MWVFDKYSVAEESTFFSESLPKIYAANTGDECRALLTVGNSGARWVNELGAYSHSSSSV